MEFKRFSKDKQEQIRQFVSYAQMCGLSGADIRSIGDKLDRMRRAEEREANKAIIAEYECLYIGADKPNGTHKASAHEYKLDSRFKLKNANGAYNFYYEWSAWHITSAKTKAKRTHHITDDYELGTMHWSRRARYTVLLDINAGKLVLDF
jgi:hypothetical protein